MPTALVLAACGPSTAAPGPGSTTSSAADCDWPRGGDIAGMVVGGAGSAQIVRAYDADGTAVGSCEVMGLIATPTPFRASNGEVVLPSVQPLYAPSIAAGAVVSQLPDNQLTTPSASTAVRVTGGVRRLSNGQHVSLSFADWGVVTTIGSRLLLEHDPYAGNALGIPRVSITPSDWCVLPDVGQPLSRCQPVGGTGAGTATVDASGVPRWIPLDGAAATVDGVPGQVGTDGSSVLVGFVADGKVAVGNVAPGTIDGRAVLLPALTSAAGGTAVAWAAARFGAAPPTFTVHQAPQGAVTFRADLDANAAVSADGHTLSALVDDATTDTCHLETFHDNGSPTTDRTIDDSIPGCGRLVRWSTG